MPGVDDPELARYEKSNVLKTPARRAPDGCLEIISGGHFVGQIPAGDG
jgi:hypothetical protein